MTTPTPEKRGRGRPPKPKPDNPPPKGKAGRPISATAEARRMTVREYAMTHVFDALDTWAEIMRDTDQPGTARAAAAAHIVNRAIGQPAQAMAQAGDTPDQQMVARIEWVVAEPVQKKVKAGEKAG